MFLCPKSLKVSLQRWGTPKSKNLCGKFVICARPHLARHQEVPLELALFQVCGSEEYPSRTFRRDAQSTQQCTTDRSCWSKLKKCRGYQEPFPSFFPASRCNFSKDEKQAIKIE